MKKILKYLFGTIAVIVVLFLAAAIILPIIYKDKIPAMAKKELNENLDAIVDFREVKVSLFKHFPHLAVTVNNMSVSGKETFAHDTLFSVHTIDLTLDLTNALKGKFDILKVWIDQPRIHAIVHRNGDANWNITKPSADTTSTKVSAFNIRLRKYVIKNGYIEYHDEKGQMRMIIAGLNHQGSGDFTNTEFLLKTKTKIDGFTFFSGKIPYCLNVKASLDMNLNVNSATKKYAFDTKDVKVNGLQIATKGFVQLKDAKNTFIDFEFSTPSNDFKDFLSLVPGIYQDDIKDVKTTGHATLSGMFKGNLNSKEIPAFELNIGVTDASVQYPGVPQKLDGIQLSLRAHNPDGHPDHTEIDLDRGHINFGTEPLDFSLFLRNPLTEQYVEATAKGNLDLSHLGEFVKLDAGTKLSGIVKANVSVKGSMAKAETRQYDSLDANGVLTVENLSAETAEMKDPALLKSMKLTFTPESIVLSGFEAQYLDTKITCDGNLHNLLGYYFHKGTLSGSVNVTADNIDGNKWKKSFTTPKARPTTPAPAEQPFDAPAKMNILVTASVDEIEYDHVKIKNAKGKMLLGDERIELQDVQAHALEGEAVINGFYSTLNNKKVPELNFEYVVSLGKLVVLRRHLDHL